MNFNPRNNTIYGVFPYSIDYYGVRLDVYDSSIRNPLPIQINLYSIDLRDRGYRGSKLMEFAFTLLGIKLILIIIGVAST